MASVAVATVLASVLVTTPVHADPPGGASGWTQTFADEFGEKLLNLRIWRRAFWWGDGFIGNDNCYYDPANVWLTSGRLNLQATATGANGKQRTGGVIETYGRFRQAYGYYEANIHITPAGPGNGFAWYLLDASTNWPPEIDIMEAPGNWQSTSGIYDDAF